MAYALRQDMIDRFGERELVQRTDRAHQPPTTIDDTVLSRALDDAAGLIDGYLAKAYALPLSAVPANLVKVSADIARYYLWGTAAGKDDAVTRAYGDALKWLQDVSRGLIQLEDGGTAPEPVSVGGARVSGSDPVLSRKSLEGF